MNDQIKRQLDQLTELDAAGLANLEGEILSAFTELESQEPTTMGIEEMTSLADALDAVRGELTRRTQLEAELKSKAQEVSSRVKSKDKPKEGEAGESVDVDISTPAEDVEVDVPIDPQADPMGPDVKVDIPPPADGEMPPGEEIPVAGPDSAEAQEEADEAVDNAAEEEDEKKKKGMPFSQRNSPTTTADGATGAASGNQELATEAVDDSQHTTNDAPKEGTAMTASSDQPQGTMVPPAEGTPNARSVPREGLSLAITAGADIPGYGAGQELTDMNQVADAFAKRLHTLSNVGGNEGQRYNIASLKFDYPESRQLARDDAQNIRKVQGVTDLKAMVAAAVGIGNSGTITPATGGTGAQICAPLETLYEMDICGEDDRPIRDALARFNADRGGVRMFRTPILPTDSCVGIWDPKNPTAKGCCPAHCPEYAEEYVEAVYQCVCFSNYTNRFFPEVIKANTDLAMIAHARLAELNLLRKIYNNSATVAVDGTVKKFDMAGIGITRQLTTTLLRVAAWIRRQHRLSDNAPMRVILPNWVRDAIDADLSLEMPGDGSIDKLISGGNGQSILERALGSRGINITWSYEALAKDGTTNVSAPSGKAGDGFDGTVSFPMFPEGSFLFLDGGTLDLGVTRDMNLVKSNEYCTFVETFEGLAFTGCASLWVTTNVCVTGQAAALVAVGC